jgi:putative DNA primase/helicase
MLITDRAQIARFVRLVHPEPDALVELRVLTEKGAHAGYYNNLDKFVEDVVRWSGSGHCYFTLNAIHPDCASRILNRIAWAKRDTLTKDKEIVRRKLILLDFDPQRLSGIPSSDEEHRAALDRARTVRDWLSERGWPEPVFMSSGNGAALFYGIDLPADDGGLVKNVMGRLAKEFDDEKVKLDTSVHNASRIARIAGTLNMKGEHSEERPHRLATILEAPAALAVVAADRLDAVIGQSESTKPSPIPKINQHDLAGWLSAHGVPFQEESIDKGIRYRLGICPNKGKGHEDGRTWIAQFDDGRIHAGCFHDKCRELDWPKMRRLIDPTLADEIVGESVSESPKDCHRFARVILNGTRHEDGSPTFALECDTPYRWNAEAWQPISDADFARTLTRQCKAEADRLAKAGVRVNPDDGYALNITTGFVGNVRNAMLSMIPQVERQPSWLDDAKNWPANEVLACSDGLIHIPTFVEGGSSFCLPLTPRFFSTLNLGYPFDPTGRCPELWHKFVNQLWPDDPESIKLLQEWLGYLLTLDTSLQKMLIMFGPGGSGKGTILDVTRHLIGAANVASLTLPMLGENHALQALVGKSLCIFPDASIPDRVDKTPLVESIKSITGEDLMSINPKHKPRYSLKLNTRLMIATNDMLDLPDPSGALTRRLLVLRFTKTFKENPDTSLRQKLLAELPGILLWAIEGWKRLRERGRFTESESGQEVKQCLDKTSSPIFAFVADCCEVGSTARCDKDDLYRAWSSWCTEHEHYSGTKESFAKLLRTAVPNVENYRPRVESRRLNLYKGIALKDKSVEESDIGVSWTRHEISDYHAEEVLS